MDSVVEVAIVLRLLLTHLNSTATPTFFTTPIQTSITAERQRDGIIKYCCSRLI